MRPRCGCFTMPNSLTPYVANEMTFITKDGALKVRSTNNLHETVYDLAKTLGARWAVLACDWNTAQRCPVWGVYDIHKASTRAPQGGMSLPLPTKEFVSESADPAVMYALAKHGGA